MSTPQSPTDGERLNQILGGYWVSQAVHVAAVLGVADHLAGGALSPADIAGRTGTHAPSLYRLLRALASIGIFAEDDAGRFHLTPMAELLRSDHPESRRDFAIMSGAEFYETWGHLDHSVRTGHPGFDHRYGKPFFEHMEENPDRHAIYDRAMNGVHGPETMPMIEAYDFSAHRLVVDIGGGNGQVVAAILDRHPGLHGILFDLPAVANRAHPLLERHIRDNRCTLVGGDFLVSVPPGADAYLMRHVIHDWHDAEASTILRNCRQAMAPGGSVLVVEHVIPPGNEPSFGKWLDLMMLLVRGIERTADQFDALFAVAGLALRDIVPTAAGVSVIRATAAP